MLNLLKFFIKDSFINKVFILTTGTVIAQILLIAASPILTRLYTPLEFGAFSLFITVIAIFSPIINGRLELAIVLPKEHKEALNIAFLALIFNLIFNVFFFLIISFAKNWINTFLNSKYLGLWIFLWPLTLFLLGIFNILLYISTRFELYKLISQVKVYRSIALLVIQIVLGFLNFGLSGLIIGFVFSIFIANMSLLTYLLRYKLINFNNVQLKTFLKLLIKYKRFPTYSAFSSLMNTMGYQLLYILIGKFFGLVSLGQFFLAYKITGLPLSLISSSISQVFYREAIKEQIETGKIKNTFKNVLIKLILLGLVIFPIMFFVVEFIFLPVFGMQWSEAKVYAEILLPMFAIRFISSSLSIILIIFQKQHIEMLINLLILSISLSIVLLLKTYSLAFVLKYLSLALSVIYFSAIFYYYLLSK